ncbi:globin domain-containing protein [Paucibacter sp. DJ1R-11]|uniref:globin domain-containing protein n=1 Tax=Paucibacter sp. DJ1R-11 TaxID=2893556 RepID=UPI0021E4092B|nr:globin domain-containing protein [Paucibacter sp. DJ1R-11]MCV2361904.1 globin domain-containing protein [Paucibacter sp. DJ1R-11]
MLSTTARPWIEATLPVVLEHGEAITRHFYQRMLGQHPELKNLFNLSNQSQGEQAQALARAVYAYAAHMDKPLQISPVLDRIAHKHVSLGITPAQYTIVGRHLLASIGEVLGEAITADIAGAWDEAYWLMASDLIAREARLYQERHWSVGGAWPDLEVSALQASSEDTLTLTLRAPDGKPLPAFAPGQYLSVALPLPEMGLNQIRQYSLSNRPGEGVWRITVKRVRGEAGRGGEGVRPAGCVSTRLHEHIRVGDLLRVGPTAGDFQLRSGQQAVVMISAGVGITPMASMLQHIAHTQPERPLVFAYAASSPEHYPLREEVESTLARLPQARYQLWLEEKGSEQASAGALPGRMALDHPSLGAWPDDADFYLCGPMAFMQTQRRTLLAQGVDRSRIHYEVFGPDLFGDLQ